MFLPINCGIPPKTVFQENNPLVVLYPVNTPEEDFIAFDNISNSFTATSGAILAILLAKLPVTCFAIFTSLPALPNKSNHPRIVFLIPLVKNPPGTLSITLLILGAIFSIPFTNVPVIPPVAANLDKSAAAFAVSPALAVFITASNALADGLRNFNAIITGFATTSPAYGIADIMDKNPNKFSPWLMYEIPLTKSTTPVGSNIPTISPKVLYQDSFISFVFLGYAAFKNSTTNSFSSSLNLFHFSSASLISLCFASSPLINLS